MTATIIWANGSKRMAHNTDDLRMRWELSKPQEWELIIDEHNNVGIHIPQFDASETQISKVMEYRRNLHTMYFELRRRNGIVKAHVEKSSPHIKVINDAIQNAQDNLSVCNARIKELKAARPQENLKAAKPQNDKNKKSIITDDCLAIRTKTNINRIRGNLQNWLADFEVYAELATAMYQDVMRHRAWLDNQSDSETGES